MKITKRKDRKQWPDNFRVDTKFVFVFFFSSPKRHLEMPIAKRQPFIGHFLDTSSSGYSVGKGVLWLHTSQNSTYNMSHSTQVMGFPGCAVVKNLPADAGNSRDMGSIPGSGRVPGVGNGNLLQYSCPENPMERGTCTVHGLSNSWAQMGTRTRMHTHTKVIQCIQESKFCYKNSNI